MNKQAFNTETFWAKVREIRIARLNDEAKEPSFSEYVHNHFYLTLMKQENRKCESKLRACEGIQG